MNGRKKYEVWDSVSIAVFCFLTLFVVYPLGKLFLIAFQGEDGGFTLGYFVKFFGSAYHVSSIFNSFKIAIVSSVISIMLGTIFSYFYSFYQLKGKKLIFVLCLMCSMSAPFIGAYAWIFLFGNAGIITEFLEDCLNIHIGSIYGFKGIVIVQVTRLFPLVVLYMNGAFRKIDATLLEASENLGVTGFEKFHRVTMHLTMPTFLASFLITFLHSLADFGTPLVIGRGYNTFPLLIYNQYTTENTGGSPGLAAAISIVSVVITLTIFLIQKYAASCFKFTINATRRIKAKKIKGIKNVLVHFYTYGIIAFSLLPQLYIIYMSFCNYNNSARQPGYTLENYVYAFTRKNLDRAIKNTVVIGVATLLIVTILAVLIAYVAVRRRNKVINKLIDQMAMIPSVIPGIVIGVAMILSFNTGLVLTGTLAIMIFSIVTRCLPTAVRPTTAALQQIPMNIEEASLSLGSSKLKTFTLITVPMMKSGLVAGAILTWISGITEVASSLLLYTNKTMTLTVGTYKYFGSQFGVGAAYASVTTIVVMVSLITYVCISKEEDVAL